MKRLITSFVIVLLMASVMPGWALAQTIKIVAFGDSGVWGSGKPGKSVGVPVSEAWPAKLERALRAKGWDVTVSNQGVAGQTAEGAVNTVDSNVPAGTKLTIVQFGGNDRKVGTSPAEIAASLSEIVAKIRAKGSAVMVVRRWSPTVTSAFSAVIQSVDAYADWYEGLYLGPQLGPRPEYDSGDGVHVNAAATDIVVARAVPDVERVLMAHGFKPGR